MSELQAPTVTPEQIELIKRTIAQGASDVELKMYLYDCARRGVHPLDKQIYFSKRNGRYTPLTSIDYLRSIAHATGEMAGIDDATFKVSLEDGGPVSATVTVYRLTSGQRFAYTATARYDEYKAEPGASGKGDQMWRNKPFLMIAKCAEALALRKAFPQQLGGLYVSEELAASVGETGDDETAIDTETGEELQPRPRLANHAPPPSGYRYIDAIHQDGEWLHVLFYDATRQHPAERYKTRYPKIIKQLREAYEHGYAVALDITPNRSTREPGYVNAVDTYRPPVDVDAQDARRDITDDPPA